MNAASNSRGCNLRFALLLIVTGLLWIGLGLYAMRTHLQQTEGIITHSQILWAIPGSRRLVNYDYTVAGRKFHGQRYVTYFRTLDWYLRDGSHILVWYDSADPSVSYPVRRPFVSALVVVGFIPIITGIVIGSFAVRQYT